MGGKPTIRGRRITPAMLLKMLAGGATRARVLEAYPVLEDTPISTRACSMPLALPSAPIPPRFLPSRVRLLADTNITGQRFASRTDA